MRGLKMFVLGLMMCAGLQGMGNETREIECFNCKKSYVTTNPDHFERKHSNFLERRCEYCAAQHTEKIKFGLFCHEEGELQERFDEVQEKLKKDSTNISLLVEHQRIQGELERARNVLQLKYHRRDGNRLIPLKQPKD